MKFSLVLITLLTIVGCEDNLNKTETKIRTEQSVCEDVPDTDNPSPINFSGVQEVVDITSNAATVKWNLVDNVYQYSVVQYRGMHEVKVVASVSAITKEYRVTGLNANTEYQFLVRAMDTEGRVDKNAKKVTIKTLPFPNFANMSSLKLNGMQYVDLGPSHNFNTKGALSVSIWFKQKTNLKNEFTQRLFTFSNETRASSGLSVGIEKNTIYLFYTDKDNKPEKSSYEIKNFSINKWHHLVVTYNKKEIRVFIDGTSLFSKTDKLHSFGNHPARIGSYTQRLGFTGNLDEFSFYKKALNKNQIKALYNDGNPTNLKLGPAKNQLHAWYRMGDDKADSASHMEDLIGNNHGIPNQGDSFSYEQNTP